MRTSRTMNAKAAENAKPERLNAKAAEDAKPVQLGAGSESRGNGRRRVAGKAGGIHRRFGSGNECAVEIRGAFVSGPEPPVSVALRRPSPAVPAARGTRLRRARLVMRNEDESSSRTA